VSTRCLRHGCCALASEIRHLVTPSFSVQEQYQANVQLLEREASRSAELEDLIEIAATLQEERDAARLQVGPRSDGRKQAQRND
jgi:hypothetical protein